VLRVAKKRKETGTLNGGVYLPGRRYPARKRGCSPRLELLFRHPRDEALFDPYLDFIRVAKALRLFERGDIILRRIVIALWM
jgi:hypothetical protein